MIKYNVNKQFLCRILPLIIAVVLIITPFLSSSAVVSSDSEDSVIPANAFIHNEVDTPSVDLTAKSAILIEASTGQVLFEKNADEIMAPASITKIMTLILIFDAIESGKIALTDDVTTSAYAASMGGSQVFLEEGEVQTVETLIKCIAVASANDACVTMGEYISGSETDFVKNMNERAAALTMSNTTFVNCCGLDADGHLTTARDIALMSRELTTKYPQIFDYTNIWMENITHVTQKGSKEFCLTNTNKLIKQYQYATGLKTGSTSGAGYCVSATASKDGIDLIAVIMASADYKVRFTEAAALLNYGFSNCILYKDENREILNDIPILGGIKDSISCDYGGDFTYILTKAGDADQIARSVHIYEDIKAPINTGDKVGELIYTLSDTEIGKIDIIATESVRKATFIDFLKKTLLTYFR